MKRNKKRIRQTSLVDDVMVLEDFEEALDKLNYLQIKQDEILSFKILIALYYLELLLCSNEINHSNLCIFCSVYIIWARVSVRENLIGLEKCSILVATGFGILRVSFVEP